MTDNEDFISDMACDAENRTLLATRCEMVPICTYVHGDYFNEFSVDCIVLENFMLSSPTFNYMFRTLSFFLLYFVSVSGDGTLSVFNVRRQKIEQRSDNMESELLSLAIVKVNGNE